MADPSLYNVVQKKADKNKISLTENKEDIVKKMKITMFEPNDNNKSETLGFLARRFQECDDSRPDDEWDIRLKQYNADLVWREDGLANVNLPIEFATIRNKIADIQSSKTVVSLLPTEKDDIYKRELMREIWEYVWAEGDTEKELTKLWYSALIFGTGWWFEGLHKETWTRYEPQVDSKGKVKGKPVTETKSWLKGRCMDIRDVWVSPSPDIEDSTDCFIREADMTIEEIRGFLSDPNFDHEEVERFIANNISQANKDNNRSSYTFQTREEVEDVTTDKYSVLHYYNAEKGIYIVVDSNFKYILREGANPYPHGELPVSLLIDNPRYEELYGIGECELLENTKYERNTVRNQIIDYARASNVMNLAVGENVAFEDSELVSGVARIWNFQGNLSDSQFIKPPSQDSSLFNLEQAFTNDATWITGVDNNSLAGAPTKTAFEARLQEQTKLKGIMVTMRQYDYFLTRMARQRLANIQMWLPYTTGKKILGDRTNDKKYRTLAFQDKQRENVQGIKGDKLVDKSVRLKDMEGNTEFLELTPKLIQSNFDIKVSTPTTTPILKELDRQDMQDVFSSLMELAQTEQGAALLQEFDFTAYYKDLIRQKGLDPEKYMKEQSKESDIQKTRQDILKDMPMPPQTKKSFAPQQSPSMGAPKDMSQMLQQQRMSRSPLPQA